MISFDEVKDFAKQHPEQFEINSREVREGFQIPGHIVSYEYHQQNYVQLKFTLSGDYIGSTVERHNRTHMLNNIHENKREGLSIYEGSFRTEAIDIIGQLDPDTWEYIKSCAVAVAGYPILHDDEYSIMCYNDATNYFLDDYFHYDFKSAIEDNYGIDLDDLVLDAEQALEMLSNCDQWEEIETIEVNSEAYYRMDYDDEPDLYDQFVEKLRAQLPDNY